MHQEKREARASRREMQSTARLEIEALAEHARDCGRHGRAQRLFERPKRLRFILCLDQDQARRGEAERVEPMAMRPAIVVKAARRQDEQERRMTRQAAEEHGEEGESRRQVACALGKDLVKGA